MTNPHETIELPKARKLIRAALKAGYSVSVYDGEEWPLKRSTSQTEIFAAIASTDCDVLRFRTTAGEVVGSVTLIWGNEDDVISDYSDNAAIEALVKPIL
jgi:hypothetical protein